MLLEAPDDGLDNEKSGSGYLEKALGYINICQRVANGYEGSRVFMSACGALTGADIANPESSCRLKSCWFTHHHHHPFIHPLGDTAGTRA